MENVLDVFANYLALLLDGFALLVVLIGAIEAAIGIADFVARRQTRSAELRSVWLRFAHWLAAALTFQLGADIVHTALAPSWNDIGRVAAIAAIRSFMVYFLDRDIESVRRMQHDPTYAEVDANVPRQS